MITQSEAWRGFTQSSNVGCYEGILVVDTSEYTRIGRHHRVSTVWWHSWCRAELLIDFVNDGTCVKNVKHLHMFYVITYPCPKFNTGLVYISERCSIGLFYLEVNPFLAIPPLKFSCGLPKLGLLLWKNRPLISSWYSILVYDHPAWGWKGALPSSNVDIYEEISLVETKGLTRIGWHHRISQHGGILGKVWSY